MKSEYNLRLVIYQVIVAVKQSNTQKREYVNLFLTFYSQSHKNVLSIFSYATYTI